MAGVGVSSGRVAPGGGQAWSVETQVSLDMGLSWLCWASMEDLPGHAKLRQGQKRSMQEGDPGPCSPCVSLPAHAG